MNMDYALDIKNQSIKDLHIITIILLSLLLVGYLCYDSCYFVGSKFKLDDDKMATYITKDTVCSFLWIEKKVNM